MFEYSLYESRLYMDIDEDDDPSSPLWLFEFMPLFPSESSSLGLGSLISPTPVVDLVPLEVDLHENNSK